MPAASIQIPTQLVLDDFGPQAPAAVAFTFGPFDLSGFLNGTLRGNVHQNVAGTLLVEFAQTCAGPFDLAFTVDRCLIVPNFQYPFLIAILQPVVRISFTNGGAASTFCRAYATALPQW